MIARAALLFLSLSLPSIAGAADISVRFYSPASVPAVRPGEAQPVIVVVENQTANALAEVHFRLTFDPAITIEHLQYQDANWTCEIGSGQLDCTNPRSSSGGEPTIHLAARMPPASAGGDYLFRATVTSTPADPNPSNNSATMIVHVIRQHIVSNTNDSGQGSLRAAIEEANAWCKPERPCEIKFRFPEGPVPVIELLSPLPPLTACGVVVGDRPVSFEDPAPIQVEVNGRHVASGPGLELRSACTHPEMSLFGMAINGFPGDGVVITAPAFYMLRGFAISLNGQRGISHRTSSHLFLYDVVIGGNTRSGIAVFDGSIGISKALIGIGRNGEDLANGASGIYIAPTAWDLYLDNTTIANNHHYGLALAGKRFVNIGVSVVIKDNISDIDWMLDGPSARVDQFYVPNTPRVLSASYDAASDTTRVTVALDHPELTVGSNAEVRLYAGDRTTIFGTAHLTKRVGSKWIEWKEPVNEPVTIEIAGDLRGQYISAVTTRWSVQQYIDTPSPAMMSTSEVSTALKVE